MRPDRPSFESEEQSPESEISLEQVISNLSAKESQLMASLNKTKSGEERGLIVKDARILSELQDDLQFNDRAERNPRKLLEALEADLNDEKNRLERIEEGAVRGEYDRAWVEKERQHSQGGIDWLVKKIASLKEAAGL